MKNGDPPVDPKRSPGPPPPSARERAAQDGRPGRSGSGRRRGGRGRRSDAPGKPPPARALTSEAETAPEPERDVPAAEIVVRGARWTVRVLGRSGAGPGRRAAPLLLLGFRTADGDGADAREALAVGSALSDLSEESLAQALAGSRRAGSGDAPGRKPFFDGPGGQARR